MCGIAGKINFDLDKSVNQDEIYKMTNCIRHRGPDDSGYYINRNVGLGFRRLSIIDLESGHQPLSNEDGTIWIVFNGEIYNHIILRNQLVQRGHKFKTRSDTEVIVHLYEEYGRDCVKYLNGMFAFAIWDGTNKKLFCARDRFGIKPFFYLLNESQFVFGSEIKSILSVESASYDISVPQLDHYLTYGYSSAEDTIYKSIRKLKPAHILEIQAGCQTKITRYWDIHYQPDYSKTEDDWRHIIREKFSQVVKSHMMSDVPLGAFLSGGIDSSAVVAMMNEHSTSAVKTFSIGFKEADFNELQYARQIAEKYGTEHHEQIVEPQSVYLLPTLVDTYDEPFADTSAIPTYYVSKFAREYVTVVLSGDGGDELFGGYNKYLKMINLRKFNILPHSLGKHFWGGLHRTIPNTYKGKGLTYYLSKPKEDILAYQSIWQMIERKKLFSKEAWEMVGDTPSEFKRITNCSNSSSNDFLFKMQKMDFQSYMVDDILTKVDRASMQNSLEVRVPLLDHEFAELTATIPSGLKIKGNSKKYIFKKSMQNYLPNEILNHKKQGFGVPLKYWFKEDLKDYVNDRLLSKNSPLYDYLDMKYVQKIVIGHNKGMRDFNSKIWSLIFLDQWLKSKKT